MVLVEEALDECTVELLANAHDLKPLGSFLSFYPSRSVSRDPWLETTAHSEVTGLDIPGQRKGAQHRR